MAITHEALRDLTTAEVRSLAISVRARTDPRDPANIGSSPGWLIALRNGLSAVAKQLEALGWERIVLVSETQVASRFREALPAEVSDRLIAESDSNLAGEEPAAIAEHLILDPDRDLSIAGGMVPPLMEGPSELVGERAVEAAIATSAQVTAVSAVTSPVLAELGGIAALLRH